eukprot:951249-Prymnesium_polylepis.1
MRCCRPRASAFVVVVVVIVIVVLGGGGLVFACERRAQLAHTPLVLVALRRELLVLRDLFDLHPLRAEAEDALLVAVREPELAVDEVLELARLLRRLVLALDALARPLRDAVHTHTYAQHSRHTARGHTTREPWAGARAASRGSSARAHPRRPQWSPPPPRQHTCLPPSSSARGSTPCRSCRGPCSFCRRRPTGAPPRRPRPWPCRPRRWHSGRRTLAGTDARPSATARRRAAGSVSAPRKIHAAMGGMGPGRPPPLRRPPSQPEAAGRASAHLPRKVRGAAAAGEVYQLLLSPGFELHQLRLSPGFDPKRDGSARDALPSYRHPANPLDRVGVKDLGERLLPPRDSVHWTAANLNIREFDPDPMIYKNIINGAPGVLPDTHANISAEASSRRVSLGDSDHRSTFFELYRRLSWIGCA